MMKGFAPVTPIWLLQKMAPQEHQAYHLPLAHDVLKHKEEYSSFFSKLPQYGKTVILDNSVIELGNSVTADLLLEAAEYCFATHLVLPDVLQKGPETVRSSISAYASLHGRSGVPKIAVVPQGDTFQEWVRCAEDLDRAIQIDMWCVPRNFEKRLGERTIACDILKMIKHVPIHLIGFSDYIYRDMLAAQHKSVIGIDSAVPIRIGQDGIIIQLSGNYPGRGAWFDSVSRKDAVMPHTIQNMEQVRRWISQMYVGQSQ